MCSVRFEAGLLDGQFYRQPACEVNRLSCPNAECPVFEKVDEVAALSVEGMSKSAIVGRRS